MIVELCRRKTFVVIEMDCESNYEISIPPTELSSEDEEFSIEALIQRVDEFQKRDQLESLDRLTAENSFLQKRILRYQQEWCSIILLLQTAHESLLKIQKAIGVCFKEQIVAERAWLAFWGISSEASNNESYSPAGWI